MPGVQKPHNTSMECSEIIELSDNHDDIYQRGFVILRGHNIFPFPDRCMVLYRYFLYKPLIKITQTEKIFVVNLSPPFEQRRGFCKHAKPGTTQVNIFTSVLLFF